MARSDRIRILPRRSSRLDSTACSSAASFAVAASAAVCSSLALSATAQTVVGPAPTASTPSATQLAPVTVTGRAAPVASVAGWGDIPLVDVPVQATVLQAPQLRDAGVTRLADVVALDPAVSDAYNAEGYYDFLSVRGFILDNRFNYRRDGLPINAETSLPLDNKAAVEVLKGTSGLQTGTSAPGGLVNLVVKRPTDTPLRSAFLEWRQPGTVTASVDLSQRFGVADAFGVRLNAAAAHLDPMVRASQGNRQLFALAADWRLAPGSLLEAEIETSHRAQPSQTGFSVLGDRAPSPGDPRINLNNQPWSLPVVFHATTASLRWQQALDADWKIVAHAMTQRLRTDDRLAFAFGCSKEDHFDRYCADGSFDFYDFRSDGEKRTTDAGELRLEGKVATGPVMHRLFFGVLASRFSSRLQPQVDDTFIVGSGTVDGQTMTVLPSLGTVPNTNRRDRSTELSVRDAVALTDRLTVWLGARRTSLTRQSVQTDGSEATDYSQSLVTPMAAVSLAYAPQQLVYASWGQGVETEVAPNRSTFANAGQPLPAQKSRQTEIGLRGAQGAVDWNLAAFDITRPVASDIADSTLENTYNHVPDGTERHTGVEADLGVRVGPWSTRAGAQWLRARRAGSTVVPNGAQPTNVPARTFKLASNLDVAQVPGLTVLANLSFEGPRWVLPDDSLRIPSVTRIDVGLRQTTRVGSSTLVWRLGIDNVVDRRAWRESPNQYGHAYLYPLAPRTARGSVETSL